MICIKHQGDVQGQHCFFLPEPSSRRWNNDLLQVGKTRTSTLTISFNVSVRVSEVDVQTLSSEHREHCHALKISQGHESQQLISMQSSNVLSHSYMLFCHDSSPGVEFVAFYDHPRNMIFAYCCMLSIKTLNLFTGHLLQGSLAAPSLDLFGRFEWHHSALAGWSYFLCSTTTPSSLPHLQSVSKLWAHSLQLHCKSMTNVPRKKAIA